MGFFEEKVEPFLKEDTDVNLLRTEFEKEIVEKAMSQVPGVIANKDEILNEKKALQAEFNTFKEKYAAFESNDVTFETYISLKDEIEALKASDGSGKISAEKEAEILNRGKQLQEEAMKPKLTQLETIAAEREQTISEINKKYLDFRAKSEMHNALEEMHIESNPIWFDGLMHHTKHEYNPDTDSLSISVYHETGYIPLSDWKNLFPETDDGKKMRKAIVNKGGGASGSGDGANRNDLTLEEIGASDNRADRIAYLKEQGFIV